jgi:hypothetical protein
LRARRDLHRVNAVMLQPGIMRSLLRRHAPEPPARLIDLGGGDGRFMLAAARGLGWRGATLTVVDRHPAVSEATHAAFAALGWAVDPVAADACEFLEAAAPQGADAVTTNLFLHHFGDDHLRRLLAAAARAAPLFAACEPRRDAVALLGSRLLWALGCGPVTRYDAPVSVRAGFRGRELSLLWPQRGWSLQEHAARPFTHCFVAARAQP